MQISKINNNSDTAFQGYRITNPGLNALKAEQNPDLKRALIDCCQYFKDKKHVHVQIDTNQRGNLDLHLRIPDLDFWISNFMVKPHTDIDYRGIRISAYGPYGGNRDFFVNLNGKPGDEKKGGRMHLIFNKYKNFQDTLFDKIRDFQSFGDEVEKAYKEIAMSNNMNQDVETLFKKQNY